MKIVTAELSGTSISFSRQHEEPKLEGENADDYDHRTWRHKLHYDNKGEIFIPGIMLKFALDYTAKTLGMKIQGRGNKQWATIFNSGILCTDPIMLGINKNKIKNISVMCNPKGIRGGGSRVPRRFPLIDTGWKGLVQLFVVNDEITQTILELHLERAGQICGLGRYAARVGGSHGRFIVSEFVWDDQARVIQ